tara:strand:- start:107 stop:763 length:657 start_codon:yes stop_codon:yes gene_type:complete
MIKLVKFDQPVVLIENEVRWTEELLAAIETGDKKVIGAKKKRYNHKDVKSRLKEETNGKCAYCESKVSHVAHGDIEHVTPKSVEPRRTFEWQNLTFACQICNQNKSSLDGIIDPYNEEPSDSLEFWGHFLRGTNERGRYTRLMLELDRSDLIEQRALVLKRYADAVESIRNAANGKVRELLFMSLLMDVDQNQAEYIAMLKKMLEPLRTEFIVSGRSH